MKAEKLSKRKQTNYIFSKSKLKRQTRNKSCNSTQGDNICKSLRIN